MAMIQRFEDIQAWQESRKLVKMIYSLTTKELFSKDYGMRDQIQRASVSTMAILRKDLIANRRLNLLVFLE